ncbi:MAG: hypothetical protein ABH869_06545, partial [Candidatus Omnitrophota bacterium]
ENAWLDSIKVPWESNLPNKTVGRCEKIVKLYDELENFAKNPDKKNILIWGTRGTGLTRAAHDVKDMMKLKQDNVFTIDCAKFVQFAPGERYRKLYGEMRKMTGLTAGSEKIKGVDGMLQAILETEGGKQGKLLIIDNLDAADESLLTMLVDFIDPNNSITGPDGRAVEMGKLKVICLADKEFIEKQSKVSDRFLSRIEKVEELNSLILRGDDVLRLAELFNREACKSEGISYAPIDEFAGNSIMDIQAEGYKEMTVWHIKQLIELVVSNRKFLLNGEYLQEEASLINQDEKWLDVLQKFISRHVITYSDLYYIFIIQSYKYRRFKEIINGICDNKETESKAVRYYKDEENYRPYFPEFASRNAKGEIVGFIAPTVKGEQPGLGEKAKAEAKKQGWIGRRRKTSKRRREEQNKEEGRRKKEKGTTETKKKLSKDTETKQVTNESILIRIGLIRASTGETSKIKFYGNQLEQILENEPVTRDQEIFLTIGLIMAEIYKSKGTYGNDLLQMLKSGDNTREQEILIKIGLIMADIFKSDGGTYGNDLLQMLKSGNNTREQEILLKIGLDWADINKADGSSYINDLVEMLEYEDNTLYQEILLRMGFLMRVSLTARSYEEELKQMLKKSDENELEDPLFSEMNKKADYIGQRVVPPVEHYTLFTLQDMYENEKEFRKD